MGNEYQWLCASINGLWFIGLMVREFNLSPKVYQTGKPLHSRIRNYLTYDRHLVVGLHNKHLILGSLLQCLVPHIAQIALSLIISRMNPTLSILIKENIPASYSASSRSFSHRPKFL